MADLDFEGLNQRLLGWAETLLEKWLPGGHVRGEEYICGGAAGGKGRSFSVNTLTGKWGEFDGMKGKGGDLVSLYAFLFTDNNQGKAFKKLSEELDGVTVGAPSAQLAAPAKSTVRLGLPPADAPAPPVKGSSAAWCYRNADGQAIFWVARFETPEGKSIRPVSWDAAAGKWIWQGWPAPRPLYGLELLAARPGDPVAIIEGEKACDAARLLIGQKYVCISWPNGAAAVDKADWAPLHGRDVMTWRDADEPGAKAMAAICAKLAPHCPRIRQLDPVDMPGGWDAADALAEGWDTDKTWAWAKGKVSTYVQVVDPTPPPAAPAVKAQAAAVAQGKDGQKVGAAASVEVHIDDGEAEGQKEKFNKLWATLGLQATKGGAVTNVDAALRVLENREEFKGLLWYDEFYGRYFTKFDFNTWEDEGPARPWTDIDDLCLTTFMQRHLGLTKMTVQMVSQAVQVYGHQHLRNEPQDWLNSLVWDGKSRIEAFLNLGFGVKGSDYTHAVSKNWWISMVARVLDPGCQADYMVILEGEQGTFKSKALRTIGGKYCVECKTEITNKDFLSGMRGKFLIVINELDSFGRANINTVKNMITTTTDNFRTHYGRHNEDVPRHCIFVATTNSESYLTDPTGGRRFWPVRIHAINLKFIEKEREQCFAEAVARHKAGETHYEMPAVETAAEQEARREVHPWETLIEKHLGELLVQETTIVDLLDTCLGLPVKDWTVPNRRTVGNCLRALGWVNTVKSYDGKTSRVYSKRPV